jgi:hypothetical protein
LKDNNFLLHIISITIASNVDCNVKFLKMAKEISKVVKPQVRGAANPSPPVGPVLGAVIMEFPSTNKLELKINPAICPVQITV